MWRCTILCSSTLNSLCYRWVLVLVLCCCQADKPNHGWLKGYSVNEAYRNHLPNLVAATEWMTWMTISAGSQGKIDRLTIKMKNTLAYLFTTRVKIKLHISSWKILCTCRNPQLSSMCSLKGNNSLSWKLILLSIIILAVGAAVKVQSRLAHFVIPRLGGIARLHTTAMAYESEKLIAELAVQRASLFTQQVFFEKTKGTVSKSDKSPVTIGDFGAQALILQAIRKNFPNDEIVAEEEATSLRHNEELSNEIWTQVRNVKLQDPHSDSLLGGPLPSEKAMLDFIDQGKSPGGPKGRIWALDPIDGTKGFLRGGQYAVCLALIVDGDVKVGVIGCPNLPVDDSAPLSVDIGVHQHGGAGMGVLFSTVKGAGASSRPLSNAKLAPGRIISMRPVPDITHAVFCEGVEAGHSSQADNAAVAKLLGITSPSVRLDSQAKYCSIARGAGDIYLRLPVNKNYQEKIWDHAAGDLLVREAGGQVTDMHGKRLDFGKGRILADNEGVVAAPQAIQGQVVDAVKRVLKI